MNNSHIEKFNIIMWVVDCSFPKFLMFHYLCVCVFLCISINVSCISGCHYIVVCTALFVCIFTVVWKKRFNDLNSTIINKAKTNK